MKIRLLVAIASNKAVHSPGDETTDFSEEECSRLIEKGLAVEVKAPVKQAPVKRAPVKRVVEDA